MRSIQVEHPVRSAGTAWIWCSGRFASPQREELKLKQDHVTQMGRAIECRINAESPDDNFRPCSSPIHEVHPARRPRRSARYARVRRLRGQPILRLDDLKLLIHRETHELSIESMRRALDEFIIKPIKTTIPVHRKIFAHTATLSARRGGYGVYSGSDARPPA